MGLKGNNSKLFEAMVTFFRKTGHLRTVICLVLSIDEAEGSATTIFVGEEEGKFPENEENHSKKLL